MGSHKWDKKEGRHDGGVPHFHGICRVLSLEAVVRKNTLDESASRSMIDGDGAPRTAAGPLSVPNRASMPHMYSVCFRV